jgi:hypothetical protein
VADRELASLTAHEAVNGLYQRWVDVEPEEGLERLAVEPVSTQSLKLWASKTLKVPAAPNLLYVKVAKFVLLKSVWPVPAVATVIAGMSWSQ